MNRVRKLPFAIITLNLPFFYILLANDIVSPFSGSFLVTIGESGRQFCLDVSVVDDEILEDTETYTLSLTSTDGDVAIATPTASLVILDTTDGKLSFMQL